MARRTTRTTRATRATSPDATPRASRARRADDDAQHDPRVAELYELVVKAKAGIDAADLPRWESIATDARRTARKERNQPMRRAAGKLYRTVRAARTTPGRRKVLKDGTVNVSNLTGQLEHRELDTIPPDTVFARDPDGGRPGRLVSIAYGWAEVALFSRAKIVGTEVIRRAHVTFARRGRVWVPVGTPSYDKHTPGPARVALYDSPTQAVADKPSRRRKP